MSAVVHYQCTVNHIFRYEIPCLGKCVTRGRFLHLVGIPHYLLHVESRLSGRNHLRHVVGIDHVSVVVTVVTHHHHGVLPHPRVGILAVFHNLLHQQLSLRLVAYRQSAYGDIRFTCAVVVVAIHLDFLFIVEHTEEVVRHEAAHVVERVLTLEAKQKIVRTQFCPSSREHTVVPSSVAKQQ